MRQIISLLLADAALSVAVGAFVYFTRDSDAAFATGLSIFIVASPICLLLARSAVLLATRRRLSKIGVKVNNLDALKLLADVNVLTVPYNRLLTDGKYFITDLVPQGMPQANLLKMAADAERDATHILGRMIFDTAVIRELPLHKPSEFRELPCRGVEAVINSTVIRVGNPMWLESLGVSISANLRTRIDQLLVKGKSVVVVSTGRLARGLIALKDEIDPAAKKFLGAVMRSGLEILLLTSQPRKMTNRIAKDFPTLTHIRTNVTADGKAREVQIFRAKGNNVAVLGNDVNDLPALMSADVSFVLPDSLPPDVENFTADFELPTPEKFLLVREIALKVVDVLKLNRRLALTSWIVLIPPAILTAFLPIPFHPLTATIGVTIFAALIIANSLRTK